ncbi:MAG TPA: MFS transporter [Xanthobacteraceae bacterium]|nr:MFS transporter [Xanthobacteraceae bacterium]
MSQAVIVGELPWYRLLNHSQWNTLIASNLGWMFDGYETFALVMAVGVALRQLLEPSQYGQIPAYAGIVIALTLLGWGIGGLAGGVITDYLGRKRTMMLAIISYSVMTGLSAFAWDWVSFAVLRFLVGVAIGSEWVTGASIVAELWPEKARGRGVGLMQCGLGIGFFLASFAWLFVGAMGPNAWRYMFLIGVLPALLTFWVRRSIPESERWERVNDQRRAAVARKRGGAALGVQDAALARFTVTDLFVDPEIRRRIVLGLLISLATTFAFWGISAWIPPYIGAEAVKAGLQNQEWQSYGGMALNGTAVIGYIGFGFLADAFGRKPVTIAYIVASLLSILLLFWWAESLTVMLIGAGLCGAFVSGQYTWMPAWLPELFPTHMRATAAGFVFNTPRLIAWLGPIISGWIIANLGGFSHAALAISLIYIVSLAAAPFLPETNGKPLPA